MSERDYTETARRLRTDGEIETAADYYTSSAHGYLMRYRRLGEGEVGGIYRHRFGYFVRNMLLGAICYRIAGEEARSRTTCQIGVQVTEDMRDHEQSFHGRNPEPTTGLCYEIIGDFRTVGGLGPANPTYQEAEKRYREVDNQHQWSVEPEFELQVLVLFELADSTGYEIDDQVRASVRHHSLEDRIQFKRDHFESIINEVIEDGNWDSDRF